MIVLFAGAAGVGKSTIAHLWCQSRSRAVHMQLGDVRSLIVSGREDPQVRTKEQGDQYEHSVAACASMARSFANDGYDVAIDDVFEPRPTSELWIPQLCGHDLRLVILHPPLEVALSRAAAREKHVLDRHVRTQHAAVGKWPSSVRINNANLTAADTLARVERLLVSTESRWRNGTQ